MDEGVLCVNVHHLAAAAAGALRSFRSVAARRTRPGPRRVPALKLVVVLLALGIAAEGVEVLRQRRRLAPAQLQTSGPGRYVSRLLLQHCFLMPVQGFRVGQSVSK